MNYEVVEIVENTYAGLFLRIKEHWKAETRPVVVVDSHISSDRHTNKVYYVAVVRVGVMPPVELGRANRKRYFSIIFNRTPRG